MNRHYISKKLSKVIFSRSRSYLLVLMVLLVFASLLGTAPTMAKYATAISGSDSARVAAFVVVTNGAENQALALNETSKSASYPFTVSNSNTGGRVGEVTTAYDISVSFPYALSGVELILKNGTTEIAATTTDNKTYVFKNAGSFPAGVAKSDSLSLNFALEERATVNASWPGISITVVAVQQD